MLVLDEEAEKRLGRLAESGDLNARDQLLLLHQADLLRHIANKLPAKLRASHCPEDFLQDTVRKALNGFDTFRYAGQGSVLAWLRMIATRTIIDANRKASGAVVMTANVRGSSAGSSSYADLLDGLPGDGPSTSRRAMVGEMREAFHLALAKLPHDYRRVIDLRFLQDRSMAEIAAELNASEESVRGLLYRARKALRDGIENLSLYI